MSPNELFIIAVTLGTFVLIVWSRLPKALLALGVLLLLSFSQVISVEQALSGFSSTVVITLIGLFGITGALEETGIVHWIARRLNDLGSGSETKLITLFMLTGAVLSLVMNNIAAGAVLLPAAVRVAQISNVRVSKLLIPLSFGTLVGGMSTYLTTANIVMSELLIHRDLPGLNMLDFLPTGGLIALCCVVYMVVIGRRLLPARESISRSIMPTDLQSTYHLEERMWELRVLPQSQLANKSIRNSQVGETFGLTLLAIWHGRQAIFAPEPEQVIHPGDILLVVGREERIRGLLDWGISFRDENGTRNYGAHIDLIEAIIAPRSNAVGKTLTQLKFRNQFGLTVVAIWRGGRSYRTDVGTMPLEVGDALLVVGKPAKVQALSQDRSYLVPLRGYHLQPERRHKARIAIAITALVLTIAILDLFSLPLVMLAGAAAMIATGCIKMSEFYDFVEWDVVFIIAGLLPLSIAIIDSGLATRLGAVVVNALFDYSPLVLVTGMFLLTVAITQVLGGQITALLVGPITLNAALQMNVNPQAMAVAVAIACSTAFLTPVAHPVNILMMGPGSYRAGDFPRVGIGMTVVALCALLVAMVIFWGIG